MSYNRIKLLHNYLVWFTDGTLRQLLLLNKSGLSGHVGQKQEEPSEQSPKTASTGL